MFGKKQSPNSFTDNLPLHPKLKERVDLAVKRAQLNNYTDPNMKVKDYRLIRDACSLAVIQESTGEGQKGLTDLGNQFGAGYKPQGSVLRKLMPNDFARHSFINACYWAACKSRWELWTENYRDDYTLITPAGANKRAVKMINQVLEDMNVRYYRNKLRDTLLTLGNCLLLNQENELGGLVKLNPLLMACVSPEYDQSGTVITKWKYTVGGKIHEFAPSEVDHLMTYNNRSNILGAPALASIETDIEAALHAAIYNANVMRKGGLLSVVFRLREVQGDDESNPISLASELTKWFQKSFGGTNHSGQYAFLPFTEGVDVLNKVGEMDSAWNNLDDRVAIKASGLLGVFPERIGIMRTSQYQNKQAVDDTMSLSMDNANYYVTNIVDEYLTNYIIKDKLGYDNVALRASGDFSAMTLTQAQAGREVSEQGADVMTVDEYRIKVLHLPPLGGELGGKFLGAVTRAAAMAKATKTPSGGKTAETELTRAVGPHKHFLPEYQEAFLQKEIHRRENIRYY